MSSCSLSRARDYPDFGWADIERHANEAARHVVGEILGAAGRSLTMDEYAEAIDWARIAALTGQPSAEAARAHYPPEPPF
jgi:hypothetical protein